MWDYRKHGESQSLASILRARYEKRPSAQSESTSDMTAYRSAGGPDVRMGPFDRTPDRVETVVGVEDTAAPGRRRTGLQ
jgi:hypothetical protein